MSVSPPERPLFEDPGSVEMTPTVAASPATGGELRHRVSAASQPPENLFGPSSPSLGPPVQVMTMDVYDQIHTDANDRAQAAADKEIKAVKADSAQKLTAADKEIKAVKADSAQKLIDAKKDIHCGDCGCGCCMGFLFAAFLAAMNS